MARGQIRSQSNSHSDDFAAPTTRPSSLSKNLNRLLSAAIVSPRFRSMLLANPVAALEAGYNGEYFQLTLAEYAAVTSVKVDTISEFAAQLVIILEPASANCDEVAKDGAAKDGRHAPETQSRTQSIENIFDQPVMQAHRHEIDPYNRRDTTSHHARRGLATGNGHRSGHSTRRGG